MRKGRNEAKKASQGDTCATRAKDEPRQGRSLEVAWSGPACYTALGLAFNQSDASDLLALHLFHSLTTRNYPKPGLSSPTYFNVFLRCDSKAL